MLGGLDFSIHGRTNTSRQIDGSQIHDLKETQRNINIGKCVSEHVDGEGDDDDPAWYQN